MISSFLICSSQNIFEYFILYLYYSVSSITFKYFLKNLFLDNKQTNHFLLGDILIKEGTIGTKMYFIQEGVVDIVMANGEVSFLSCIL